MSLGQHELYPNLDVSNAVQLPTSPDYTGNTTYYMFMTKNLPLLEPVRANPFIGNPIADFIQPDLRVLVDLGYSDWGSGQDYANVPTPATLFPIPNPFVIGTDLVIGRARIHRLGGGSWPAAGIGATECLSVSSVPGHGSEFLPGPAGRHRHFVGHQCHRAGAAKTSGDQPRLGTCRLHDPSGDWLRMDSSRMSPRSKAVLNSAAISLAVRRPCGRSQR